MKSIILSAVALVAFGISAQNTPEHIIVNLKNGGELKYPIASIESVTFDNGAEIPDDPHPINGVTTGPAQPKAFSATITGAYTGDKLPSEIGFQYSYDKNFPTKQTGGYSVAGQFGSIEFKATGLVDQIKVYYRVYAIVDGEYIYGETKSFETLQGTYTIDGVTYKFIKVTGLATGSFSMMQTELPPKAEITIDGESIGCWAFISSSSKVTAGETRTFLDKFANVAVIPRYPTPQEWMYAAAGGSKSNGYKYSGSNDIDSVAWYTANSNGHTRRPAQKEPNELGFYDMSGNYAECCAAYDEAQLKDAIESGIKCFVTSIQYLSAKYFETSWIAKGGAFGGYWGSEASKCQTSSSVNYKDPSTKNLIDCDIYTARLVYSRPD